MIVVDSSAWIAWLRTHETRAVMTLDSLNLRTERIGVPDLVLLEVCSGARGESDAARIERTLRRFEVVEVGGEEAALEAARHYRRLRSLGVTIRSSIDLLIATYCLRHDCTLLHQDRDFTAMERHLGLRCL